MGSLLSFTWTDIRPPPTFTKKAKGGLNRAHTFSPASPDSVCTRRGSAWGTSLAQAAKPPSKADPWSTLGPKRVHAGGGICHPEDRLGRGVQRPESGLGREFWSHGYPQCGLEGAANAHWQVPWITWATHPVGEEVCLEKRQRESLNQSFPKCDYLWMSRSSSSSAWGLATN